MSLDENKVRMKRVAKVFSTGYLTAAAELCAPELVNYDPARRGPPVYQRK